MHDHEPWNLKEDQPILDGLKLVATFVGLLFVLALVCAGFVLLDAVMSCPK